MLPVVRTERAERDLADILDYLDQHSARDLERIMKEESGE
jgi:plasmid stabilization system protein ParE